jgi:hypothetical protein
LTPQQLFGCRRQARCRAEAESADGGCAGDDGRRRGRVVLVATKPADFRRSADSFAGPKRLSKETVTLA